jgi:hypothetical protein
MRLNLHVGGRVYSVQRMTPEDRMASERETGVEGLRGYCDVDAAKIAVWPDLSPCLQAEVLLHETLHAVWEAVALGETAEEEAAVTGLTRGLTQVLRDNPAWLAAILRGLAGKPVL